MSGTVASVAGESARAGATTLARVSSRRLVGWWVLFAGVAAASALGNAAALADEPVLDVAFAALAVEGVLLGLAVGIALLLPGSPRARLGLVAPRLGARDVALLAFGTLALSHALDSGLVWSGRYDESELSNFARSMQGARGVPLLVAALAVAGVAPLAEELLCRGLVQRSLAARIGPLPALVIAAAVFGLLHVEPIHAGLAMGLGLYLGVGGWLAGSVWVPIGCHVLNNAVALAMSVHSGPTATGTLLDVGMGLALAAAALLVVLRSDAGRLQPAPGSVDG